MGVREWIFGVESFALRGLEQTSVAADQYQVQAIVVKLSPRFQCRCEMDCIVCFERMLSGERGGAAQSVGCDFADLICG